MYNAHHLDGRFLVNTGLASCLILSLQSTLFMSILVGLDRPKIFIPFLLKYVGGFATGHFWLYHTHFDCTPCCFEAEDCVESYNTYFVISDRNEVTSYVNCMQINLAEILFNEGLKKIFCSVFTAHQHSKLFMGVPLGGGVK